MKVALIRPPQVHEYWSAPKPLLGLCYLSSFLKSNNIDCKIFDANFYSWDAQTLLKKVLDYNPDILGITAMTHEIGRAGEIAKLLHIEYKNKPIVIGGCHATALPGETLETFQDFDYAVFGEGEKTFLELARHLEQKKTSNLHSIQGIAFRDADKSVYVTEPRQRLTSEDLDKLSYPDMEEYYTEKNALKPKNEYYAIISSRGCPYNCAFCMQVLGHQVRRRSPESVVAEIKYAVNNYSAHTIYFADEIFLFNDGITYKTLKLIQENGLNKKIRWRALTRANIVTEDLIREAKKAGCFSVEMGIESGNDEILKIVNKKITIEQIKKAVAIIKKHKIAVEANFILGHPYETTETIKDTIRLAAFLNTNSIAIGIMTPYPGTKVYDMARKGEGNYRLLSARWDTYDKYGGRALELNNIDIDELEKWQRKGLLFFYIKNLRILDLAAFALKYRRMIFNLLFKNRKEKTSEYTNNKNSVFK